jgi:alpha-D-ribose 1-methylphosphonate 5-triphosphate synthase subunit PhnH
MSNGNTMVPIETTKLKPGFSDAVFESQTAFRAILSAMAYAGRIHTVDTNIDSPAPLAPATTALALTLFDFDTSVWLDAKTAADEAVGFLKFHCGCPIIETTEDARFGIIADVSAMPAFDGFAFGEDRYPDRSTTLIVQVPTLTEGPAMHWSGPGIKDTIEVRIGALPADFHEQWALNHELYPLGLDLIFVSGTSIIGLPRGIRIEG